jgi:hypothetical protein
MGALAKFDISNNHLCAAGAKVLAEALIGNQTMTELNVASNRLGEASQFTPDMSGVIALAGTIKDMGAISSVNLLLNDIGIEQAGILVSILKDHPTLKSLCGNKGNETALDMSGKMNDAADNVMLVTEIIDNGALLVLSLKGNDLLAAGGKALAEGLKGNQVITELNIANNYLVSDGRGGADTSGVIALAGAIPQMGAILSVHLLGNNIGMDQTWALAKMLTEHPALKSLCGHKGNETELDMSCKKLGITGAIMLASEIANNETLLSLNLSKNEIISRESGKALAAALAANTVLTDLDLSSNQDDDQHLDGTGFAEELAVGIKDSCAISALSLSGNKLKGGGIGSILVALEENVSNMTTYVVLVSVLLQVCY